MTARERSDLRGEPDNISNVNNNGTTNIFVIMIMITIIIIVVVLIISHYIIMLLLTPGGSVGREPQRSAEAFALVPVCVAARGPSGSQRHGLRRGRLRVGPGVGGRVAAKSLNWLDTTGKH